MGQRERKPNQERRGKRYDHVIGQTAREGVRARAGRDMHDTTWGTQQGEVRSRGEALKC